MGDLTNGVGIFLLTQSILSIEKKIDKNHN